MCVCVCLWESMHLTVFVCVCVCLVRGRGGWCCLAPEAEWHMAYSLAPVTHMGTPSQTHKQTLPHTWTHVEVRTCCPRWLGMHSHLFSIYWNISMSLLTHVMRDLLCVFEGFYLDSVSPGIIFLCCNSMQYFHISFFVYPGTCSFCTIL